MLEVISNQLFDSDREIDAEKELAADGLLVYSPPSLHKVWLTEPECHERCKHLSPQREITAEGEHLHWIDTIPNDLPAKATPDNDECFLLPLNLIVSDN